MHRKRLNQVVRLRTGRVQSEVNVSERAIKLMLIGIAFMLLVYLYKVNQVVGCMETNFLL
ncbi:hypothetical protein AK95_01135 [Paenibacillus sp. LC231]|nr:hypothetical protein AK95_01135 [Paenibacillus sp. LC231]